MHNKNKESAFLEKIKAEYIFVSVYLKSGIRLEVHITDFDDSCLFIDSSNLIYKHAIATVVLGKLSTGRYSKTAS